MPTERHTFRAAAHLILEHEGNIFLLRRCNTGYSDGLYGLIAGHIDANEQATHAMAREAQEEAGIIIDPADLVFVHVMHRRGDEINDRHERIDFFFKASKWQGTPKNNEPEKCDHADWFPLNNLPKNLVTYIPDLLKKIQNGQIFTEAGWNKTS